jgi:hypothetical protein
MKKNILKFALGAGLLGLLPSCVTSTYMLTDNAVGSKIGVARFGLFGPDRDMSLETAAKNGKITKIGTVEVRTTTFIIPFSKTIVTGE